MGHFGSYVAAHVRGNIGLSWYPAMNTDFVRFNLIKN